MNWIILFLDRLALWIMRPFGFDFHQSVENDRYHVFFKTPWKVTDMTVGSDTGFEANFGADVRVIRIVLRDVKREVKRAKKQSPDRFWDLALERLCHNRRESR